MALSPCGKLAGYIAPVGSFACALFVAVTFESARDREPAPFADNDDGDELVANLPTPCQIGKHPPAEREPPVLLIPPREELSRARANYPASQSRAG